MRQAPKIWSTEPDNDQLLGPRGAVFNRTGAARQPVPASGRADHGPASRRSQRCVPIERRNMVVGDAERYVSIRQQAKNLWRMPSGRTESKAVPATLWKKGHEGAAPRIRREIRRQAAKERLRRLFGRKAGTILTFAETFSVTKHRLRPHPTPRKLAAQRVDRESAAKRGRTRGPRRRRT